MGADWYTPAGGSGPAYVTVALVNKATGTLKKVVNQTINPGQQNSGASDTQLSLKISLGGALTDPTVKFEIVPA